jgi:PRTRC genetic system ThiF family protein
MRQNPLQRVHFTHPYLLDPQHPVTVNLIGAGGTGSQVLTCLARMDCALRGLGHPGLYVKVYDPDTVSATNVGRQMFFPSDVGQGKANCLVSRINAGFGTDWQAEAGIYPTQLKTMTGDDRANLFITCTDNIASRFELSKVLDYLAVESKNAADDHRKPYYWLDLGNARTTGQAILGTIPKHIGQPRSKKFRTVGTLPVVTEYDGYNGIAERDSGPSCSLAEALHQQDLFINSVLAQLGCNLIWKMLRSGMTRHRGLYLNLETLTTNPISV